MDRKQKNGDLDQFIGNDDDDLDFICLLESGAGRKIWSWLLFNFISFCCNISNVKTAIGLFNGQSVKEPLTWCLSTARDSRWRWRVAARAIAGSCQTADISADLVSFLIHSANNTKIEQPRTARTLAEEGLREMKLAGWPSFMEVCITANEGNALYSL